MNYEKPINFELSYPVSITSWNGKIISLMPESEVVKHIEIIRNAGIRFCMVAGLHTEERLDFDIFHGAKKFGDLIAKEGLKISSHHCLFPTFTSLDYSQNEIKVKMKKTVDFCSLLKTEVLVIHPGRIEGEHKSGTSINRNFELEMNKHGIEKVLDVVAENFRDMGEYASRFGIKIALENLGRFEPLGSIDILPELIAKINLPNVGYCFDSGHAHAFGESVTEWIETTGDKLFATHLHDNHGRLSGVELPGMFITSSKKYDEHLSPGFGTINWTDIINSLRKVSYNFPVNFETGGWPDDDPLKSYKLAIKWWRKHEAIAFKKLNIENGELSGHLK